MLPIRAFAAVKIAKTVHAARAVKLARRSRQNRAITSIVNGASPKYMAIALGICCFVSIEAFSALDAPATLRQVALPDTSAITPAMVNAGRAVFHGQGTCFACHGASLEGGPIAPTLRPHAWKDAKAGGLPAIYGVITHGVSGTAMVSHPGGISDADAVRVATYVWSVSHRGAKP